MPYISREDRNKYEEILRSIEQIDTKGDLEFCISILMDVFMKSRSWRYSDLHDCTYAAQHCADEFRRRFLDKREDEAVMLNGDCFKNITIPRLPEGNPNP